MQIQTDGLAMFDQANDLTNPGIMGVLPLEKSTTYWHAALRAKPVRRI